MGLDEQFEVVWSGAMSRKGTGLVLVAPRATVPTQGVWEAPLRIYNKSGKHAKKTKVETVHDERKD